MFKHAVNQTHPILQARL